MAIPVDLAAALAALPADPRFELVEGWQDHPDGRYSFKFRARLSVPESLAMPEWTAWHLVAEGTVDDLELDIYPDAEEGITATFQHQDNNIGRAAKCPWRLGKPCLDRPAAVFERSGWDDEPTELTDRIEWRLLRLFEWIDGAARGTLTAAGDPAELPSYPAPAASPVLGFQEAEEDLAWWTNTQDRWGFASLGKLPGVAGTMVICELMDPTRRRLRELRWTPAVLRTAGSIDAIWMRVPAIVAIDPWQAPTTFQELEQFCAAHLIDLGSILADAGGKLRRYQRRKASGAVHLLIGFPLAERIGEEPRRFHWIAIADVMLCGRKHTGHETRHRAEMRRSRDRAIASSTRAIEWRATANWAPDQLRKRGQAEDEVRSRSVLIIGVGSLGSAVAENLLRMGVTDMALLDAETLVVGNLSRHQLTLEHAGASKAKGMAARLNLAAPDAHVEPLPFGFPPTATAEVERLGRYDVVIDCTASDRVLRAMATFPWLTERLFVSLAMTWEARGLFAYAASETGFPAIDAIERFSAVSPAPEETRIETMEGIGCWHPIFPATADDVQLWAAIGSKFVRRAVLERKRRAVLYVQNEDGSVERRDA